MTSRFQSLKRYLYTFDWTAAKFFVLVFLLNLPFLLSYSDDLATTFAKFDCDENGFSENLYILFNCLQSGRIKGFAYNLVSYGYGPIFWFIYFVAALPGLIFHSEQALIIAVRLVSLIATLASFFLVYKILQRSLQPHLPKFYLFSLLLFAFLSPIVVSYSNMFHPETLYAFFIILALYYLVQDNGALGKPLYYSIFCYCCALSTKLIAGFACPIFIVYWLKFFKKFNLLQLFKATVIGIFSLAILNIALFLPLVGKRFFAWVTGVSQTVISSSIPAAKSYSFCEKLVEFNSNYVSLGLLCLTFILWCVLRLSKSKKDYHWMFDATAFTVISYLVFVLHYCQRPYHYGIMLCYFLPVLYGFIISTLAMINARWAYLIGLFGMLLNLGCTIQASKLLLLPGGNTDSQEFNARLIYLKDFVKNYPKDNLTVGTSRARRLKKIPGKKCTGITLTPEREPLLAWCDLIFFDKKELSIWGKLPEQETFQAGTEADRITIFRRIEDNQYFLIYAREAAQGEKI